jgi:hypothetical protein
MELLLSFLLQKNVQLINVINDRPMNTRINARKKLFDDCTGFGEDEE